MDNEIVIRNPRLLKIMAWLEKQNVAVQAFVIHTAFFIAICLLALAFWGVYLLFGWVGALLSYVYVAGYLFTLRKLLK